MFFGCATLSGEMQNPEWGYFSLAELVTEPQLGGQYT